MTQKRNNNGNIYEVYKEICKDSVIAELIVSQLLKSPLSEEKNIEQLIALNDKNIKGKKLCKLFQYCCDCDIDKLNLTILALRFNIYTKKEIDRNLSFANPTPFINDEDVDYSYFTPIKRVEFYKKVLATKEIVIKNIESKTRKKKILKK